MKQLREKVYSFDAQWFDANAQLVRKFSIRYFVEGHQIEIVDRKSNRLFLKKTSCPDSILPKDFFVGSKLLIYGRNYELTDYLDQYTRDQLGQSRQKVVAIILPDALNSTGKILDAFSRSNLTIASLRMLILSSEDAAQLYEKERGETYFNNLIQPLCQAPVVAVQLVGDGSIEKVKQMVGPLRARYSGGNNNQLQTVLHVAENSLQVETFNKILFEKNQRSTATYSDCTCCVIQPHILKDGRLGQVIDAIQSAGYAITAMELFNLDRSCAAEFLEVYDGVVPHFNDAVDQLIVGPCVALEVCCRDEPVQSFRQTAGPWDIEMAKELRPDSIRARFGIDRVKNGIHCTDLPQDGVLESQYFFDIISKR